MEDLHSIESKPETEDVAKSEIIITFDGRDHHYLIDSNMLADFKQEAFTWLSSQNKKP